MKQAVPHLDGRAGLLYLSFVTVFSFFVAIALWSLWARPLVMIGHGYLAYGAAMDHGRLILFLNTYYRRPSGFDIDLRAPESDAFPEFIPDYPGYTNYNGPPGGSLSMGSVTVHRRFLGIESRTGTDVGGNTHEQFVFPFWPVVLIMGYGMWRLRPKRLSDPGGFAVVPSARKSP